LKRLDPPVQRRVIAALDALVATDLRSGNIRKLSVQEWRLRVGDWRVRFDRDHDAHVVVVLHILPRGRAYRD
jgi:mRNA-degrading endonuclease RelE of RelBE toxin-antitoxin system